MAGIPGPSIGPLMHDLIPMVSTLGLAYDADITPAHAVVVLRDQPDYRNHVGGPHAAAMFLLGESATGAAAVAAFGDMLDRAVLLPMTAGMEFLTIARGDLTATASMSGDANELRAIFDAGGRPEFEVVADITDADGTVTGRLRTRWTLKALKRA